MGKQGMAIAEGQGTAVCTDSSCKAGELREAACAALLIPGKLSVTTNMVQA